MLVEFLIEGQIEYAFASRRYRHGVMAPALSAAGVVLEERGFICAGKSHIPSEIWDRDGRRLMFEHGFQIFIGYRYVSAHELICRRRDSSNSHVRLRAVFGPLRFDPE